MMIYTSVTRDDEKLIYVWFLSIGSPNITPIGLWQLTTDDENWYMVDSFQSVPLILDITQVILECHVTRKCWMPVWLAFAWILIFSKQR